MFMNLPDDDLTPNEGKLARQIQGMPPAALSPAALTRLEQRALKQFKKSRRLDQRFVAYFPRFALAFSITITLFIVATGTVAASADSLPSQPLYGVKRLSEQAELFFAPVEKRPTLHAANSSSRLIEIQTLATRGLIVPGVINDLNSETQAAISGARLLPPAQQTTLLIAIVSLTATQEQILAQIQYTLPITEPLTTQLARAQLATSKNRREALTLIEGLTGKLP